MTSKVDIDRNKVSLSCKNTWLTSEAFSNLIGDQGIPQPFRSLPNLVSPPDHKGLVTRNTNGWLNVETMQHLNDVINYIIMMMMNRFAFICS